MDNVLDDINKISKSEPLVAIERYKAYLAEYGDDPKIHGRIAICYIDLNDYESAHAHVTWSIANAPGNGDSHLLASAVFGGLNKIDEARREAETAIKLMPEHPNAHWNKALYSLQLGEYEESWRCYQYGRVTGIRPIRNMFPAGSPSDWKDATLHIWCEQGHGDIFMCARFLRYIKETYNPAQIIFETYDDLIPLFYQQEFCDVVYKRPDNYYMPYSGVDYSFSLWDTPYLCNVDPRTVPTIPEDVNVPKELLEAVKPYMDDLIKDFKIGVCWYGNREHINDVNRSSTFEDFVKPLLNIKDTTVVGLQYGDMTHNHDNFLNLGHELANWAITAAYILQMDLIITADTAVAHLAGVLGKQTWIVCPYANEWRWGYISDPSVQGWNCDWYGSNVSIFRQTERKNWNSVIPVVVDHLKKYVTC